MRWLSVGGEEGFGAHDVDAALGIDELGDVDVAGDGDEGVGVVAGEVGVVGDLLGEEGDHVADGHLGGGFEVFVEAHGDVLGGGFGAGPEEMWALSPGWALWTMNWKVPVSWVSRAVMSTSPLPWPAWPSPTSKRAPLALTGMIEGGAGDHLLVVDVAGVHPGWGGVVLAGGFGRGDAHAAEEGMKGDVDAGGEVADHLFAVEGDDAGVAVGEVVGEEAAAGAEAVAGPGDVDVDFLNADFEDVAGFGFGDGDGAGEDVAAGAFFAGGDFVVDVGDVGGDVGVGDAEGFEALG